MAGARETETMFSKVFNVAIGTFRLGKGWREDGVVVAGRNKEVYEDGRGTDYLDVQVLVCSDRGQRFQGP